MTLDGIDMQMETFRPAFAMTSGVDLRDVAGPVRMIR